MELQVVLLITPAMEDRNSPVVLFTVHIFLSPWKYIHEFVFPLWEKMLWNLPVTTSLCL
jgi:hypothetical protein